jgi:hypothetical protein
LRADRGGWQADGKSADMEDRAPKRFWIFSRRRREKIASGQLPTDVIPAHKAGGNSAYGAFGAVYEWFILDDDRIGVLDEDNRVCEETETGRRPLPHLHPPRRSPSWSPTRM